MPNNWITDHRWHDIPFSELPDWVKRRKTDLNQQHLLGRSFEYRRDPSTGKYQRKLRRHAPTWLVRLRRSLPKLLLVLAATATVLVVLLAAAASIAMSISLGAGLMICIVGLLLMAWPARSLGKSRPTLVSTVLRVMVCFLFRGYTLAYLDIRSMSDIRATTAKALHSEEGEFRQSVEVVVARMDLQAKDAVSQASESVKEMMDDVGTTSHVYGLALHNNPDASNPTWDELVSFLANDDTDSHRYDLETFNCGDFAQMLHNRAEKAGIRTAFVVVQLGPCEYWPSAGGHCLNAFETIDRCLVFIDCTGCSPEFGDCYAIIGIR